MECWDVLRFVSRKSPYSRNLPSLPTFLVRVHRSHKILLLAFGGVAVAVVLSVLSRSEPSVVFERKLPLVLRGVQALGTLHTAKHRYENVFEYSTHRRPQQWVAMVPGGSEVVAVGTRNVVLVSASGEIEAGVDLSRATIEKSGNAVTVWLPKPQLFEPKVDAKVHWQKSSVFWRDENISLKAVRDVEDRIKAASLQQNILETASDEASKRVKAFASDFGVDVTVKFS